jgi:hypothetical protein
MGRACSTYGEEERCVQGFDGGDLRERTLGRSSRRWEDNIKIGLQEIGWGVWTGLIWLRMGTGGGNL